MTEILELDATGLLAAYADRSLSPVEVVDAHLEAIDRTDPVVNAFVLVDHDQARSAATASEQRWLDASPRGVVDGLPFTVKDNLAWAGHPTRRGSPTSSTEPAVQSAPSVDRLVEAGAIPVGKTTLPEFGWKGIGDSPLTGVTRNPWDTRMTTGGSSSGAAAAAVLNAGVLHLGTDGAGSIRIPAGFCGVYGVKPTFGRVPVYPPSAFAALSHVGPLTRTVTDAALMMEVIAAPDVRDMTAMSTPPPAFRAGLDAGISGLRVAWSSRLGYVDPLDAEVEQLAAAAARAFEELGAVVEEADPGFLSPIDTLKTIWYACAAAVVRGVPENERGGIDPGLRRDVERGWNVLAGDYAAALNARGPLFTTMARFHERYDLLLTPTLATPAFEVGTDVPHDGRFGDEWLGWTPYTYPFNLTMQPAATVPCGFTELGLPVGLQIVGPHGRDDLVLQASRAFEAIRPWPTVAVPNVRH